MKTQRMFFLLGVAVLTLTTTPASGATHASPMMTRPTMTRPAPRFAPRTMMGMHRRFNDGDNDRDDRFRHFPNRTFIFFDRLDFRSSIRIPTMGTTRTTITVTRITDMTTDTRLWKYSADLLALVTTVDPSTGAWVLRRAIRTYERDHNMPAYGVIDQHILENVGPRST
jgi:hypothetical protein